MEGDRGLANIAGSQNFYWSEGIEMKLEEMIERRIIALIYNHPPSYDKEAFKQKYWVWDDLWVLLFAMWDWNHSFATAKAVWETKKKELSEEVKEELGCMLSSLDIGENIKVTYYNISKYENFSGRIKKIDRIKSKIIFQDLFEIKFDNILEIARI